MTASGFRDAELARFEASGWCRIGPLAAVLPGIDPVEYLRGRPAAWWSETAEIAADLRETIAGFRFADEVEIGVLFVPPVPVLDTRRPVDVRIRQAQRGERRPRAREAGCGGSPARPAAHPVGEALR